MGISLGNVGVLTDKTCIQAVQMEKRLGNADLHDSLFLSNRKTDRFYYSYVHVKRGLFEVTATGVFLVSRRNFW